MVNAMGKKSAKETCVRKISQKLYDVPHLQRIVVQMHHSYKEMDRIFNKK